MADKKFDKKPSGGGGGGGGGAKSSSDLFILAFFFAALLPLFSWLFAYVISPLELLIAIRQYFTPFFAENSWWIKIVSVVLSALFLWGTVYIIIRTNYFEIKKEQFLDTLGKDYLSRHRSLRGWQQIKKRLHSQEQNDWKLAILEADYILNEILKRSGYLGGRMEDKLDLITSAQLANVEDVWRAHGIRDKISKDPTFAITRQEAVETVAVYRRSFIELNLIKE